MAHPILNVKRVIEDPKSTPSLRVHTLELTDEAKHGLTIDLPPGAWLGPKIEPGPVSEEYEAILRGCGVSDLTLRAIQRDRERWAGRRHGLVGFIQWALGL